MSSWCACVSFLPSSFCPLLSASCPPLVFLLSCCSRAFKLLSEAGAGAAAAHHHHHHNNNNNWYLVSFDFKSFRPFKSMVVGSMRGQAVFLVPRKCREIVTDNGSSPAFSPLLSQRHRGMAERCPKCLETCHQELPPQDVSPHNADTMSSNGRARCLRMAENRSWRNGTAACLQRTAFVQQMLKFLPLARQTLLHQLSPPAILRHKKRAARHKPICGSADRRHWCGLIHSSIFEL